MTRVKRCVTCDNPSITYIGAQSTSARSNVWGDTSNEMQIHKNDSSNSKSILLVGYSS